MKRGRQKPLLEGLLWQPCKTTRPLMPSRIYSRSSCIVPIPLLYLYLYILTNMHSIIIIRYFIFISSFLTISFYRTSHTATVTPLVLVIEGPKATRLWRRPAPAPNTSVFPIRPQRIAGAPLPSLRKAWGPSITLSALVPLIALRPFAALSCAVCLLRLYQALACRLIPLASQFKTGLPILGIRGTGSKVIAHKKHGAML